MATLTEIQDKKAEIEALKKAYLESIASGGVIRFEQGSTRVEKASTQMLKRMKEEAENQLVIMERTS
jgi:hypothetical protein